MALDLPSLFLLSTHLQPGELHALEDRIPSLTYDAHEAEIIVGKITTRERAMFELRRLQVETIPFESRETVQDSEASVQVPSPKRRRISSPTAKDAERDRPATRETQRGNRRFPEKVQVLKLRWLTDSLDQGKVLPVEEYLLYTGRRVSPEPKSNTPSPKLGRGTGADILKRAAGDQPKAVHISPKQQHQRRYVDTHSQSHSHSQHHTPSLTHQTTSEHDLTLPPIPDFLKTTYSCQRPTPTTPPNDKFVEALKDIRTIRLLQGDQVGVRAYSTSIATLAAYPYLLQSSQEVLRLPGCGAKIAELYQQWKDLGYLDESHEIESNPMVSVLKLFYDIWGVGDSTARWRDLDDLVEYGWQSLSRVQQIGVKYYDEFQLKIPRDEVASIGSIVLEQARQIDVGYQMVIVGGYRRGKKESGDVDVLLSHPDEAMTANLIEKMISKLEKSHFITHTLSLSTRNSERGQAPLPWKGEGRKGSGFDTLDKALVVWKDAQKEDAPHRRVDIIISPWKTVGCAMLGWSGGTTFQRDLRRYCKAEKGWKFDSSGIRRRADGAWVDLESGTAKDEDKDKAPDMETAERRVFEGLGLPWRRPEERCTG